MREATVLTGDRHILPDKEVQQGSLVNLLATCMPVVVAQHTCLVAQFMRQREQVAAVVFLDLRRYRESQIQAAADVVRKAHQILQVLAVAASSLSASTRRRQHEICTD